MQNCRQIIYLRGIASVVDTLDLLLDGGHGEGGLVHLGGLHPPLQLQHILLGGGRPRRRRRGGRENLRRDRRRQLAEVVHRLAAGRRRCLRVQIKIFYVPVKIFVTICENYQQIGCWEKAVRCGCNAARHLHKYTISCGQWGHGAWHSGRASTCTIETIQAELTSAQH